MSGGAAGAGLPIMTRGMSAAAAQRLLQHISQHQSPVDCLIDDVAHGGIELLLAQLASEPLGWAGACAAAVMRLHKEEVTKVCHDATVMMRPSATAVTQSANFLLAG